ncbi:hypothetical protein AC578_8239 [Pseudocercospora eumusae]|uniref:Luciferase domain-containing protein n=1 Tax=Pseudocercospora eumusae TaxID=321146 RepID=A0A139HE14_9PEZI|nr:hypothetical protein AC578_8239 [Pseudocercospora eumusae]
MSIMLAVQHASNSTSALCILGAILITATIIQVSLCLRRDFLAFKALGPGGTPSTVPGYIRVKLLGLFALRNPYEPAPIPEDLKFKKGYLCSDALPQRPHARPETRGIAPHRQITQRADQDMFVALKRAIEDLGAKGGDHLTIGTSCFEKKGTGLFSTSPTKRTCRGEICHVHSSDGSLHLTLHPLDARTVLEAGWGERHPISRGGVFERFVPKGFLMVYAPQKYSEIAVVLEIVKAAAWYVGGEGSMQAI